MQVIINGKHMDVGDSLRAHIEEKIQSGVQKYFDSAIDAKVVVSKEGHGFRTDSSVHVGTGIKVQGHSESDDVYASVDGSIEKIAKRLRRYKRRLRDHHKTRGDRSIAAPLYVLAAESEDATADEPDNGDAPVIVAEELTQIESLTVGEAVMRMTLAEEPVLFFHDRAHGRLNAVFQRRDGNIGWIDPNSKTGKSET